MNSFQFNSPNIYSNGLSVVCVFEDSRHEHTCMVRICRADWELHSVQDLDDIHRNNPCNVRLDLENT
jgi:hypothetical protein